MHKLNCYIFIFLFAFLLSTSVSAKNTYFDEGKKLFEKKKFSESKFKFEKDIVFNPKSEMSYLYLAKIFNEEKSYILEEQNLNTVILLNPQNEEAVFLLTLVKIRQSDYSSSEKLIDSFKNICVNLCDKQKELITKLKNLQTQ